MIRVLLVDDHRLVRASLCRMLEAAGDIRVCCEAATGEEAIRIVREDVPEVVIMDVSMPGIGGMEATRKLRNIDRNVRVIVVSAYSASPYPRRLLEAGASAFLSKDCEPEELVEAVRAVKAGKTYLSANVARALAEDKVQDGDGTPLERLSQRELQVLVMVVQGQTNGDISRALYLSPKTVSTYRARLYSKLGVANDVELTHFALRHGLTVDDRV